MRIHDISMTIHSGMQVYKSKPEMRPELKITRDFDDSAARETTLCMNLHTGTHMDMPLHFIPGGATIDQFDISRLVTACHVIDLTGVDLAIHAEDLMPFDIREGETILFKTKNSLSEDFDFEFVYLATDGAEFLAAKGINCVGTDSLGIERAQSDHGTHKTLLGAGIIIIEGLRLKDVPQGRYELCAVPIKIAGAEAAPVRAFLIER